MVNNLYLYCQKFIYIIQLKVIRQYKDSAPQLEVIESHQFASIHMGLYHQPYFERSWHYHPEFELLLITSGYGRRMVGDHSEKFFDGDLVLLGPRLPHAWISDEAFIKSPSDGYCESIYIQFNRSLFTNPFFEISEFHGLQNILEKSNRGLKVTGKNRLEISEIILTMKQMDPLNRLLTLIRILNLIGSGQNRYLASEKYLDEKFFFKSKRMNRVHNHLMEHFKDPLTVDEGAELVNMTVTSFCRFFKNQTGSTFTIYLNRIRIDFARKLLVNTETSIKEIGYECGFNSTSYFNQTFKRITGISPKQYRNSV